MVHVARGTPTAALSITAPSVMGGSFNTWGCHTFPRPLFLPPNLLPHSHKLFFHLYEIIPFHPFSLFGGGLSPPRWRETAEHRIKQTNTKLREAMLNRVTHGSRFIFSKAFQKWSTLESEPSSASVSQGPCIRRHFTRELILYSDTLFN